MRPQDRGLRLNGGNGKFAQTFRLAVTHVGYEKKKDLGRVRFQKVNLFILLFIDTVINNFTTLIRNIKKNLNVQF